MSDEEEEEDAGMLRDDAVKDEEEEEEEVAVAVLCRTAGDFVFVDSLDAAESAPCVFWKKSKMPPCRGLEVGPPDSPSVLE